MITKKPKPSQSLQPTEVSDNVPPIKTDELYNEYEGNPMAKSLDESIEEFLRRLRPSETDSAQGPWIWIANPSTVYRPLSQDIASFRQLGFKLLQSFLEKKYDLEDQVPKKPVNSITRILFQERKTLEASIKDLAIQCGIICGKWMLFPDVDEVDEIWATVSEATLNGKLGCAAKVGTRATTSEDPERLICIYTVDFTDVEDVKRVLRSMKRLKLVEDNSSSAEAGRSSIYYKSDAYTYLDITSQNEFKLRASMYSSKDLFVEMRLQE